ncbi:DUF2383 domain-containing protein [Gymnodinialimonas hymeniacidonis]|uniref:DUF2383 domain-containing protein n=1 Tax=Gymnodinialimonas hymeniacidonis TaxID=3126508 RepID=UPI0034C6C04A
MATQHAPIPPVTPTESTNTSNDVDAVQKVLTRTLDALAGYDKMLPEAEPEVAPILRKLRETHHSHADQLSAMIVALGGTPETDGSFMSKVNETVVSLRAFFDEIDDDALERVIEGEEWVTDAFGDAAKELPEGHHRDELVKLRGELEEVLKEARVIAD